MKKIAVELQLPELPDFKNDSLQDALNAAFQFMRMIDQCRCIRGMFDHLDDDKEEIDNAFEVLGKAGNYWFKLILGDMEIRKYAGMEIK